MATVMTRAGALVPALVVAALLTGCGTDDPAAPLSVTWGGSEGSPSCSYDADASTVDVALKVVSPGADGEEVRVTVTAYADENTSRSVGSGSRTVRGGDAAPRTFHLRFPVDEAPHQGEDDVIACGIEVD